MLRAGPDECGIRLTPWMRWLGWRFERLAEGLRSCCRTQESRRGYGWRCRRLGEAQAARVDAALYTV